MTTKQTGPRTERAGEIRQGGAYEGGKRIAGPGMDSPSPAPAPPADDEAVTDG